MILTPDGLIKKYFPVRPETTRDLYNLLDLEPTGYTYLNWIKDLEEYCLSKYLNDFDYNLLPDNEKNYWISPKAFKTIVQSSPSKKCDEIRVGLIEISKKVGSDPAFAKELQNQMDKESGIEIVTPKVSKALKTKYNTSGQDAFEFSVKANNRLYMDIISGYNFQPGQKIKNVTFELRLDVDNGVPQHMVDITLSLTDDHKFSFQAVWCCNDEKQFYAAILLNKIIRINLYGDNKKLVDSYDYILTMPQLKKLESELGKVINILEKIDPDK
jgi:hypothetical protein